jgi:Plasmid pRiA4b ORF-3-like protein
LHDERKATLRDLASGEGDTFGYEYDLGDSWEHEVLLEKLVPAEPGRRYPSCLDGARACPPEDCGGTGGYEQLIDALADPRHPDHDDLLHWLGMEKGTDFDPARFDPADADRRLDAVILAATRMN